MAKCFATVDWYVFSFHSFLPIPFWLVVSTKSPKKRLSQLVDHDRVPGKQIKPGRNWRRREKKTKVVSLIKFYRVVKRYEMQTSFQFNRHITVWISRATFKNNKAARRSLVYLLFSAVLGLPLRLTLFGTLLVFEGGTRDSNGYMSIKLERRLHFIPFNHSSPF